MNLSLVFHVSNNFSVLKKDNERIGQTFKFLGDAFELDDREGIECSLNTFTELN